MIIDHRRPGDDDWAAATRGDEGRPRRRLNRRLIARGGVIRRANIIYNYYMRRTRTHTHTRIDNIRERLRVE